MSLPNFLIVGAPRAGTTSLYYWLTQHPSVFMSSIKEPHYYAVVDGDSEHKAWCEAEFVRSRAGYEALFDGSDGFAAVGEASTTYLQSEGAPQRIAEALGQSRVRLIAVLRNPAERAFSHYLDHLSNRSETIGRFRDALRESPQRASAEKRIDWDYLAPGFYARHIERYLRWFPRESIKIVLFEDLSTEPAVALKEICGHLGIDPAFEFDTSVRHNSSRLIAGGAVPVLAGRKFTAIRKLIPPAIRTGLIEGVKSVVMQKPKMSAADRARLIELYRPDIQLLEKMLGRSLGHWYAAAP
jgi:hypothetical protein